jgi:pimeloyl-ACP methyl ester carboxylesterase
MAGSSTFTWRENLTLHSKISPFHSPLPQTHSAFKDVKPISWRRYNIAGLLITVYGLEELASDQGVTCLWLLHGRGDTQDSMSFTAAAFINAWNDKRRDGQKGLICVCFDQRNHGSRMIDNLANESWKASNASHGVDMFTLYSGTAQDVSMLITYLPSYLPFRLAEHWCGGVSLGGHASWHVIMHDPRVTAAIIVIGCADYTRLMTDRAIRSKLAICMSSDPPGRNFLGSAEFPKPLIEAVERYDPAGLLLGELDVVTGDDHLHPPSESELARLRPIMREKLAGKKLLLLSGGKDKLVPYEQNEAFLTWLKKAIDPETGWFGDQGVEVEDIVDPTGRHEFSAPMRKDAERWLCDQLSGTSRRNSRESKM